MEVREYIIKVQDGDMDDEIETDLYGDCEKKSVNKILL